MPEICTVPRGDQKKYSEKRTFGGYYTITSSGKSLNIVGSWDSVSEKISTINTGCLIFMLNCPVTATVGDIIRD